MVAQASTVCQSRDNPCSGKSKLTLTPESAYTTMGIPEIRRYPPIASQTGAKT